MEIWRYGDMEIWRYGDMEIWKLRMCFVVTVNNKSITKKF